MQPIGETHCCIQASRYIDNAGIVNWWHSVQQHVWIRLTLANAQWLCKNTGQQLTSVLLGYMDNSDRVKGDIQCNKT